MKRHSYTITELLTVIAIIAILAGIAIPAVGYSRRRARTSACISNQGQTMKTLINAMADNNNRIYSGTTEAEPKTNGTVTEKGIWTMYLAEKGYIKSVEALRCPDINTETDGKTVDAANVKEVYGLVTTDNNKGRFDFRGTKLFMYGGASGTQISPSALAMGGCSTSDGKTSKPTIKFSGSGNNLTGVHHNSVGNIFFFDGHAESVNKNNFAENKYYPDQTADNKGEAKKIADSAWRDAAK